MPTYPAGSLVIYNFPSGGSGTTTPGRRVIIDSTTGAVLNDRVAYMDVEFEAPGVNTAVGSGGSVLTQGSTSGGQIGDNNLNWYDNGGQILGFTPVVIATVLGYNATTAWVCWIIDIPAVSQTLHAGQIDIATGVLSNASVVDVVAFDGTRLYGVVASADGVLYYLKGASNDVMSTHDLLSYDIVGAAPIGTIITYAGGAMIPVSGGGPSTPNNQLALEDGTLILFRYWNIPPDFDTSNWTLDATDPSDGSVIFTYASGSAVAVADTFLLWRDVPGSASTFWWRRSAFGDDDVWQHITTSDGTVIVTLDQTPWALVPHIIAPYIAPVDIVLSGSGLTTYFPPPPPLDSDIAFFPAWDASDRVWPNTTPVADKNSWLQPNDTIGPLVAVCGGRDATVYALQDDAITGFTTITLYKPDVGAVPLFTRTTTLHLGTENRHSVMELPIGTLDSGFFYRDLLTINRDTGDLIRVSTKPGGGIVEQAFGLNLSALDGAVNDDGTRLVYLDGPIISVWDLILDENAGTILEADTDLRWLVWATDCTLFASTAARFGNGPIRRYAMGTGELLQSYAYAVTPDPPFTLGQVGLAVDIDQDRVWVIGQWNKGSQTSQGAALVFRASTGGLFQPLPVPLIGTGFENVVAVGQPYRTLLCNPFPQPPPSPEFIGIRRELVFPLMPDGDLNQRKYISRFEILVQAGVGLPGDVQGSNPLFTVQFSDGGKVWGPLLTLSAGRMGEFGLPVFKNRLGYAYNPWAKLVTSDPVDWQIIKCTIDVEIDESVG